jgi:hypothetical protein
LSELHSSKLFHADLRPETILPDGSDPILTCFGIRQPWKESWLTSRPPEEIKYISSAMLQTSTGMGAHPLFMADEYAFAMITSEFVEDKLAEVKHWSGEIFTAVIARGARPQISEKFGKFAEPLTELWASRREPFGLQKVVEFLKKPENWIPGVNVQHFWKYTQHLDDAEEELRASHLPEFVSRKLMKKPQFQSKTKASRERTRTLNAACLAALNPPLSPRSFFTTMLADISAFTIGRKPGEGSLGAVLEGTLPDSATKYGLKKILLKNPAEIGRMVVSEFVEICTTMYAIHPAVVRVAGWSVFLTHDPRPEFWIITHVMPTHLKFADCRKYSPIQE